MIDKRVFKHIMWSVMAVVTYVILVAFKVFSMPSTGIKEFVLLIAYGAGVIWFFWLVYYLISEEIKTLTIHKNKYKMIWWITVAVMCVYIISGVLMACENDKYNSAVYEMLLVPILVLLYTFYLSALFNVYNEASISKTIICKIICSIALVSACAFICLSVINDLRFIVSVLVLAFATSEMVGQFYKKYKMVAEISTFIGYFGIWCITDWILYRPSAIAYCFSSIRGRMSIEYYNELIEYLNYRYVDFIVLYVILVITLLFILYKILRMSKRKNRVLYINYSVAFFYLTIIFVIETCGFIEQGTDAFDAFNLSYGSIVISVVIIALILYSSKSEMELIKEEEIIKGIKCGSIKDFYGKEASNTLDYIRGYLEDYMVILQDKATNRVETFIYIDKYSASQNEEKEYAVFSLHTDNKEILILELKGNMKEASDIELHGVEDKEVEAEILEAYKSDLLKIAEKECV